MDAEFKIEEQYVALEGNLWKEDEAEGEDE